MRSRVRISGAVVLAAAFVSSFSVLSLFAQTPAAPAPDQPAAGALGRLQMKYTPPARINKFVADPSSIQPGQSFLLVWATENPAGVIITPGIGTVAARGTRKITPEATTTYTITVYGPAGSIVTKAVTVTVAGTVPLAASAAAAPVKRETPRLFDGTPDGRPDLSGVYSFSTSSVGTAPQLKAGAEKFKAVPNPNGAGILADCMPTGVPQSYFVPFPWQIVQGRDQVVIAYEYLHLFRVIPINGAPHPVDPDPTWMGDSVGHWEGETLVVDTIGFNDKTQLPGNFHHTEALHVVERFRRVDFDHLQWDATIEDPNVFTKPWTMRRTFQLRGDLEKVDEYVCENNKDDRDLFGKQ